MGRPKHICQVTTVHAWSDTRIFERMCVGLARRGYQVTLVAPVPREHMERGVRIVPTGLDGKIARILGAGRLVRQLRDIPAHVFHFHDPELLPWMTWFRANAAPRRVVYDVHEYYPESVVDSNYFRFRPLSRLAGAVFRSLEPRLGRSLDAVVGVTEPIANAFRGGRGRVAVVRNFVPLEHVRPEPIPPDLPSPRTLVLAGVMDRNRLMPELIDALGILSPRWPDLCLLGIGDLRTDPFGTELRIRAAARGISDRVVFRDRLPWHELQRYIAASTAGLVLLTDRQTYRWSLPNRLFEFMAHAVPVVATDHPLIREVVTGARCGLLLDSGTPESIVAAMEFVLENPAEARAMGRRGQEAVGREYNWELELDRLETLYASL